MAQAREAMTIYAQVAKLGEFGVAALARRVDDAAQVAKTAGTSIGKAKAVVQTGKVLGESTDLSLAMQQGNVLLDQASEIASAEQSAPGAAKGLLKVAAEESFHALKDKARATKLEAEQHRGLAERQHRARSARSYNDALGMTHIHLSLEPHIGAPIVARAEAEAARIAKQAKTDARARLEKRNGHVSSEELQLEPFERHLADAYATLLSGSGKGRAKRPELVVLVSHEVATRGWKDVKAGEVCKIPGVGPVAPGGQGDRPGRLSEWLVLRRQGPAPAQALVALDPGRGPGRLGAGRTARVRRSQVHRLRQPLPHRVRPPRTALPGRADRRVELQESLLVLSPGQDQERHGEDEFRAG